VGSNLALFLGYRLFSEMNERIPVNLEIVMKCSANIQIQKAGTKVASQDAKTSPASDLER
jgi:hypothetical protein